MCAILTREPFLLRFADVARLNDYQIYHCLLRPRTEDGLLVRPRGGGADEQVWKTAPSGGWKEVYADIWRLRGAGPEEIERRWQNYLEQEPGLREQLKVEGVKGVTGY